MQSEVKGNLLPKPAVVSITADYLDSFSDEDTKYKAHAAYGDDYRADVEGILEYKFKDGSDKK